ncbi:MAG: TetR/AcrR family transcriptional regulator [Cognatishimia sp.]|uniref:TetR/AcrR family transcriptional regulator n=1 Tax=Cognatishimia sp. TaxID=2211648 RepID=UPI003B8DE182
MPRVSADEKERSHARIIKEASKAFRSNGLAGTRVADVMKAAGLTHGGFYRHFSSRAELLASALEDAIKDAMSDLEHATTPEAQRDALLRYVDLYLSPEHVQNVQEGCPLAAAATEAGRGDATVRQAASAGSQYVVLLLSRALANTTENPEAKAHALLSLLIGTVTFARIANGVHDVDDWLNAAKLTAHQILKG